MNPAMTLLIVALGGAFGAITRYQLTQWGTQWLGTQFPYATLLINVAGSFLMGVLMSAILHQVLFSPYWRPFIAVGFLGALTTFSTFSIDTLLLFTQGEWLKAILNMALHLLLCMAAVTLGFWLLSKNHA